MVELFTTSLELMRTHENLRFLLYFSCVLPHETSIFHSTGVCEKGMKITMSFSYFQFRMSLNGHAIFI